MSETPDFVGEHDVDRTTLDIIESTLSNTRYEMDRVVETTAISPVIREQSDQFPLIADAKGRMVIGQFGSAIDTILANSAFEREDLADGDVIATNDPYMCAGAVSHTPDMLLLRPIFYEGDLVGFSSQWGNLMDVGGKTPGSMPVQARTIFEEGVRLPPVKLYKGGEIDDELLESFAHNTRLPEHAEADIKALAAGTKAAETRIHELCDRFGKETYVEACDAILDRTRDGMINLIHEFVPEGERYTFEDYVDDDGMGNGPIKLHLEIYREGETVYLDWTGTDEQVPGTVNFLLNEKMFKMFTGVFLIMAFDPLLTFNDGYYDLFEVTLPEGSVVQPEFPAALGNRLPLMARQFDVLQATFSKLIEGFSVAGSYGTSPNLVYAGTDSEGNDFQMLEILYGGIPARPGGDGLDGHSWWPMFRTVPAEYQEAYYPLSIDEYSTRTDTGGPGEFRGGHGITKVYTFEEPGAITFQDDRAHTYPWGVDGGSHAETSEKTLVRTDGTEEELPSKVENVAVAAGDKLVFSTAGGGGLGDPLERDPTVVAREVRRGLISESAARTEYGVVLDEGSVDDVATEDRRGELDGTRDEPPAFDYGPLPDDETLEARIAAERREFAERHD
ncbi:hydantoinase B/oxoprolinase family protein [Halalkalicoccus jeotgali]|uniref:N-methylhydantoinase (ATP-hydrolyzing) B 2 n=1 Tax=Halalkalicoccus jeotgali (strain DSM 18796 / CECT 7217 / JCM 14584 / KCTC 4019 / B3) TaxID=795797 RepID=D8J7C7_HALJB|nr:hydantoinase B/oxoprolinase family protein [Halalkalicoccus jeotgali]ADJ14022.1 N-methylhydantoinase (ATP-hydrolyzing) B 2 [Halalkalicoccus jeotgali B3]ELY33932.1 N-methylhydantoinase B 2 [Halalkalicoccus jeotgali B3]